MRTVRTTMQPDVELEVGEAEYLDLSRQHLLVVDEQADVAPPDDDPDHDNARTASTSRRRTTKEA